LSEKDFEKCGHKMAVEIFAMGCRGTDRARAFSVCGADPEFEVGLFSSFRKDAAIFNARFALLIFPGGDVEARLCDPA
jgi:hypothetical protein